MWNGKYYVVVEKNRKGEVIAYTVNDSVGGLESEHARYAIDAEQPNAAVAHRLATMHCDDLNDGIE
jgi:hypothetical protein